MADKRDEKEKAEDAAPEQNATAVGPKVPEGSPDTTARLDPEDVGSGPATLTPIDPDELGATPEQLEIARLRQRVSELEEAQKAAIPPATVEEEEPEGESHTCPNCGAVFAGKGSRTAYREHRAAFHPDAPRPLKD